ncbi:MAG: FtsX-like permease family protein, partial [Actinomycetota bacterium]
RAKWRGWLGLALMIAAFGGTTLATVAGARRTDSAYPRFLLEKNPFDQFLLGIAGFEDSVPITRESLADVPQVQTVIDARFVPRADDEEMFGSPDPRFDRTFNGVKVVDGRLPERADEIGVPVAVAEKRKLHVGSTMRVAFLEPTESGEPKPFPLTMTVAGIIASPGEFPPESDLGPPVLHLTSAFFRAYDTRILTFPILLVWLKNGSADLPAFRDVLTNKFGGRPVIGYTQQALTKNVQRAFHLQAVSLALFAACLAIVTLLVLGQTLGRQALTEGVEYPSLRALGVTRSQLFSLGIARAAIVALAGGILAVPIAFALSPLAPLGLARAAEPKPGFAFDATALLLGGAVIVVVLLVFAGVPAFRAARQAAAAERSADGGERGSRVSAFASQAGASAPAVIGTRLALEPGRGRTAVPVRTTVLGVALAIAALSVSFAFGDSLRHLLRTPRLYGVTWDTQFEFGGDAVDPNASRMALARVKADPRVEAAEFGGGGIPFLVDRVQADGMVVQAGHKTFLPVILEGRAPQTGVEIVLGSKTLERIHRKVGDTVLVAPVGVSPTRMTVVGRGVLPTAGHTANLGEGSLVTYEGLRAFEPLAPAGIDPADAGGFLVRFRPGTDRDRAIKGLNASLAGLGWSQRTQPTPADLLNFGRSKNLPLLLSGMLGLLALATLAHALVTSITRRRRDLAILKTLGFTRGDTRRTVAWQSTTLLVAASVAGLTVGAVAGRWLWTRYAEGLGILPEPRVPVWILLAILPIGLVVANAIALIPGRSAARTQPALVLRTE